QGARVGFPQSKSMNQVLFAFQRSRASNFAIVSEVPLAELTEPLDQLRNLLLLGVTVLVFLVIVAIGSFLLPLSRALLNIQRQMKRAETGEYEPLNIEYRNLPEVTAMQFSYNSLIDEIKRLIDVVYKAEIRTLDLEVRNRESRLQVLQSQINPHFLYNSLEFINSYAIMEDVPPISRMAEALSRLFRYNIKNP